MMRGTITRIGRASSTPGAATLLGPYQFQPVATVWIRQAGQSAVERYKASAVSDRQGQQVGVCHLPVSDHSGERRRARICRRGIVLPEHMAGNVPDAPQQGDRLDRGAGVGDGPPVARDSHESRLGERAGRPAAVPVRAEPGVRVRMMDVIGPGQRDEDVDVKEPGQMSSRASRTISGVSGDASLATSKTGKPSARSQARVAVTRLGPERTPRRPCSPALPGEAPCNAVDVGIQSQRSSHDAS